MLQCPNCKEFGISYFDTIGARPDTRIFCGYCDQVFIIPKVRIIEKLLFQVLGMFIVIILLKDISQGLLIFIGSIVFFLIDYLLNKSFNMLIKLEPDKNIGIIKIDKKGFIDLLETLSKAEAGFITIFENENVAKYLEITYKDSKYNLSLSLTTKSNCDIENNFYSISENLGYIVHKHKNNKIEYLQICLSENREESFEIVKSFIRMIFNLEEIKSLTVSPDGI